MHSRTTRRTTMPFRLIVPAVAALVVLSAPAASAAAPVLAETRFPALAVRQNTLLGSALDLEGDTWVVAGGGLAYVMTGETLGSSVRLEAILKPDDGHDGFTGADRGPADYTQPDLAEQERFEAGLNAYFVGHRFKSMLTWRRTRRREGLERERGQGALVGDAFIAQLQLGWL